MERPGRLQSVRAAEAFYLSFVEAQEKLAKDVRATTGFALSLKPQAPVHDWELTTLLEVHLQEKEVAASEITFTGREDFLLEVAELVQEAMMDELGSPWPACPSHGEPLSPSISVGRQFVWMCEGQTGLLWPVGTLKITSIENSTEEERWADYWRGHS